MRIISKSAIVCVLVCPCPAAPTRPIDVTIRLPADPDAVVLTLDYPGGGMAPWPVSPGPYLIIRAGGRVTVNDPTGKAKKAEGTIRGNEIQALLRFAVTDRNFFEYDDDRVRETIRRNEEARELFRAFDLPYPLIRIRTADREHQACLYPVSPAVGKPWPSDPELAVMRGLGDLEGRLRRLMARVSVGGEAELKAAVRLANEHLRRQIPKAPALTSEHLCDARQSTDGRTEMMFFQSSLELQRAIELKIETLREGDPTVTVRTLPLVGLP